MNLVNKEIVFEGFNGANNGTNKLVLWVSGDNNEIFRIIKDIYNRVKSFSTLEVVSRKKLTFEESVKPRVDYNLPTDEESFLKQVSEFLATLKNLSSIDYIPKSMLLDLDFVPMNFDNAFYMGYPLTQPDFNILRSSVESKQIKLFNTKRLPSNFLCKSDFIPWVYLYRSDISFMVNKDALPSDHWALDFIMDIDEEEFILQTYNERSPTSNTPSFFSKYNVNLCDYYTITHKGDPLVIDNIAVAHPANNNGSLLFPINVKAGDDHILRQVKTYEVNLKHDQKEYSEDKKSLLKWVQIIKKRRAFSIVK